MVLRRSVRILHPLAGLAPASIVAIGRQPEEAAVRRYRLG